MLLPILLLLAGAPVQEADPLAPARQGKIRCVQPDTRARTCATMVRYSVRDDGRFDAVVTGVVASEPLILLEYRSAGQVEDGAVCAVVRPIEFSAGRLSKDGAPLSPAVESNVRSRLMLALQPLAGHKRCFRDKTDAEGVLSDVMIDGSVRGEMRQRVLWVSPEDGYAPGI
jgi:hypothetical protein